MNTAPTPDAPWFEAVIVPHRSLGRSGLLWVATALCLLSAVVGLGLLLAGAWPVVGFSGAEVLLAIYLLRRHARQNSSEMLLLSDSGLRLVRTDRAGRRSERLLPIAWLRPALQERPGRTPALMLHGPGAEIEVGAELGEAEKRDLAAALDGALRRFRSPAGPWT